MNFLYIITALVLVCLGASMVKAVDEGGLWVVQDSDYCSGGDCEGNVSANTYLNGTNMILSGLINCDTIDTDSEGFLLCGNDAGAAAGGGNLSGAGTIGAIPKFYTSSVLHDSTLYDGDIGCGNITGAVSDLCTVTAGGGGGVDNDTLLLVMNSNVSWVLGQVDSFFLTNNTWMLNYIDTSFTDNNTWLLGLVDSFFTDNNTYIFDTISTWMSNNNTMLNDSMVEYVESTNESAVAFADNEYAEDYNLSVEAIMDVVATWDDGNVSMLMQAILDNRSEILDRPDLNVTISDLINQSYHDNNTDDIERTINNSDDLLTMASVHIVNNDIKLLTANDESFVEVNNFYANGSIILNETSFEGESTFTDAVFLGADVLPIGSGVIDLGTAGQLFGFLYVEIIDASQGKINVTTLDVFGNLNVSGKSYMSDNLTFQGDERVLTVPFYEATDDFFYFGLGQSAIMLPYQAGLKVPVFGTEIAPTTGTAFDYETSSYVMQRNNETSFQFDLSGGGNGDLTIQGDLVTNAVDGLSSGWNGTFTERDGSVCYVYSGWIYDCP